MDCATYRHLFGRITNSCVIYHCNFPSHNLLSIDTLLDVSKNLNDDTPGDEFLGSFPCYEPFPYSVRMSFPLFIGSGVRDRARDLIERKLFWETKLKKLRVSNIDGAIAQVKKLRHKKSVKLPESLKKYIEHFHNDPEPMFSGNYNWLYTGGCLSYAECSGTTTLVAADYLDSKPGFCLLQLNETLDEVSYKSFFGLKTHSEVHQISCKSQQENIIISVRQKNYLSLFKCNRDGGLCPPVKLWRKKVLNSKLLTCVDLMNSCETVILTDSDFDVHVFNVENGHKVCGYRGKGIAADPGNCWSQVAFGDCGVYWAFKDSFGVFDLRDFYSGTKLQCNPRLEGDECEEICSFVPSPTDSNFVYLSTTHSLLQVDLRKGKTVQKWTHMMENSPQFMTNVKDDENEFLVLQSQTVGETSGIVNGCLKDGNDVKFVSKSLPCLLTSIRESLNVARFRGECLNPVTEKRVNFAVTGMQCLKNADGEVVLLTNNSGGDIFLSKITKKTGESDSRENQGVVLERMKVYESRVENLPLTQKDTDGHPELFDMSHLLGGRQSRPDVTWKRPEIHWKYEALYAPESLTYYRDVLAKKILEVWGYGSEDSDPEEKQEVIPVDVKVREWMEKY